MEVPAVPQVQEVMIVLDEEEEGARCILEKVTPRDSPEKNEDGVTQVLNLSTPGFDQPSKNMLTYQHVFSSKMPGYLKSS